MTTAVTILQNMVSDLRIPVDVIAGFRGAGKTTFIRSVADALWSEERVVILQNEDGRETLPVSWKDGRRVREQWAGGCICCAAVAQFAPVIQELAGRLQPDRIIIEAAQTARLDDIRALFTQFNGEFRIDHMLYVVNAADFGRRLELSQAFVEKQLRETPAAWINRLSGLDESAAEKIVSVVRGINPRCTILDETVPVEDAIRKAKVHSKIIAVKK